LFNIVINKLRNKETDRHLGTVTTMRHIQYLLENSANGIKRCQRSQNKFRI